MRTKNGVFKRPIQRIYPSEVSSEESAGFTNKLKDKSIELDRKKDKSGEVDHKKDESVELDYKKNVYDSRIVTTRSGHISRKPDPANAEI